MKTNQELTVSFKYGDLHIGHKTMTGSLTDLFRVGNIYRLSNGDNIVNQNMLMNTASTKDFIALIAKRQNIPIESIVKTVGRGKNSRTEANLHLLIYIAEKLSLDFHYDVIDCFITNKLLYWRDESGDNFKALNLIIDKCLPGRNDKSNRGIYIQLAMLIKSMVQPDGDNWNTATADQLRYRNRIEDKLVSFLELGLVRDYDHLKELAVKL